jgi:hypothetical protein
MVHSIWIREDFMREPHFEALPFFYASPSRWPYICICIIAGFTWDPILYIYTFVNIYVYIYTYIYMKWPSLPFFYASPSR